MGPSRWAQDRFGVLAAQVQQRVALAIQQAHTLALNAHGESGLHTHDTYAATMRVTQFEQLVAATADLPGVVARKPADVHERFEYVVIDEMNVAIYPWRYGRDTSTTHLSAKLRTPVSGLRKNLWTLAPRVAQHQQLTIDQAALAPEELEAQAAEDLALLEQMARFGRMVTVAYASHPDNGVFGLVWGDAELADLTTGAVRWDYDEPLVMPGEEAGGAEGWPISPVAPVSPRGGPAGTRFDAAPLSDDFGLRPRNPLQEAPSSEPTPPPGQTGSDQDDERP